MWSIVIGLVSFAVAQAAVSAETQPPSHCADGVCTVRLTAEQVLTKAEFLVSQHRFAEAAPLLAALENAPQYALERKFLTGYTAVETGDLDGAIKDFRSILVNHPEQTRVRLELARALMLKGKTGGADYHYRLAQEDETLPADVVSTIRTTRGILRNQRQWNFNLDIGFAPDTNISNGSSAESVDVVFDDTPRRLTLDPSARARSGTGQTLGFSGGVRINLASKAALLIDADSQVANYVGKDYDDIAAQIAVGPEFRLSDTTSLSVQAVGAQRWFGGKNASLSGGVKAGVQHSLTNRDRIGFSLDGRRVESGFSGVYSGWQIGGYATYERVISRSMIASTSLFMRRDELNSSAYAGTEFGGNVGLGGELPLGITAGVSGGVSRARYDAPVALFSTDVRQDWRYNARANLGLRSIRIVGFSPSFTYTFSQNASSIALYDNSRHRIRFALARYF